MSQWIALSFVPPVNEYELPSARCTVPSIFSSKRDVLHEALDARVAADAELAEPARALVGVERLRRRNSSPRARRGVDDAAVPEDEPRAFDLVPEVARPGTRENSITPSAESSTGE